jgi:hypothetical protein
MSTVIDFDEFRKEAEGEEKFFKIGGIMYPIAPQIPAVTVLKVLRLQADVGAEADVTLEVFDDLGRSCFGSSDAWDELLIKHRVGYDEIPVLITALIQAYSPKAEGETDQTSETKESSSPSSKPGRGSKRTSSASTGSTSSPT